MLGPFDSDGGLSC